MLLERSRVQQITRFYREFFCLRNKKAEHSVKNLGMGDKGKGGQGERETRGKGDKGKGGQGERGTGGKR